MTLYIHRGDGRMLRDPMIDYVRHDGSTYRAPPESASQLMAAGWYRVERESLPDQYHAHGAPVYDDTAGTATYPAVLRPVAELAQIKRAEIRSAADAAIDSSTGGNDRAQRRALQRGIAILNRARKGKPSPDDGDVIAQLEALDEIVEQVEAKEADRLAAIDAAEQAGDATAIIAVDWGKA